MIQIAQDLRTGEILTLPLSPLKLSTEKLLICSKLSIISPGTEKSLLAFGRANWLEKIKLQPEKFQKNIRFYLSARGFKYTEKGGYEA